MNRRARIRVSGRVQGVFYRDSARAEARRLGLAGWVRNLPGGRVEIVAEGAPEKLDELIAWCRLGPPLARVDGVEVASDEATGEFSGFDVIW